MIVWKYRLIGWKWYLIRFRCAVLGHRMKPWASGELQGQFCRWCSLREWRRIPVLP